MNTEIANVARIKTAETRTVLLRDLIRAGQSIKSDFHVKSILKDSTDTLADSERLKNKIAKAVEYFEKFARDFQFDLRFSVDESSNSIVIKVLEKGTDKVIRQIPPDEILRLRQRISDLLGALYDSKA